MKEGSLLKRTLIVTGLLVGVSAAWVTLVSVTVVTAVDRAIAKTPAPEVVAPRSASPEAGSAQRKAVQPAPSPARGTTPNG